MREPPGSTESQGAPVADASEPDYERTRRVFVVHGRNETARAAMFTFLRSIGLTPIEWSQAIAMTKRASPYIGEVLDVALEAAQAVVVLMTPDETASLRAQYADGDDDPEMTPGGQARPNVLFEAGLALGRSPDRTVLVELGKVRHFSDIAGRHVVRMRNSTANRQTLAQRLLIAGCAVDLTGTDWHSAGDFIEPPSPNPQPTYRPSVPQRRPAEPPQYSNSYTPDSLPEFRPKIILGHTEQVVLYNVAVKTTARKHKPQNHYELVGEAKNNDTAKHTTTIRATFYGDDGRIMGTASDAVFQLAAGDTKTFTMNLENNISSATSVKVYVDIVL
jgi:predicted nucleotide-binding protein